MEAITHETFLNILSFLSTSDLKEAQYVSRRWNNIIRTQFLYKYLLIDHHTNLDKATLFFIHNSSFSRSVRSLQIHHPYFHYQPTTCFQLTSWPQIFPKISHFNLCLEGKVYTDLDDLPGPIIDDEGQVIQCLQCDPAYFEPWLELQDIKEKSKFIITSSLLHAGNFVKLTKLDIDYSLYNDNTIFSARKYLFSALEKNVPNLKYLHLNKMPMSLSSLDALHKCASTIEHLRLTEVNFVYTDDAEYNNIVPACSVKQLELDMVFDKKSEHSKIQLAQYISRKYINTEDLTLHCENDYETERWNKCMLGIFRRCKKIKQFDVGVLGYNKELLQVLDSMESCRIPRRYMATVGKFEELRLLAGSKQRFNIEEMTVSQQCHDSGPELVCVLSRFPNLVSFCLNKLSPYSAEKTNHRLNIPINTLLGDHPELLTLELNDCKIYKANFDSTPTSQNVDPNDYTNKTVYYPLKTVRLINVMLYNKPCMMGGALRSTENWFFARMYLRCTSLESCTIKFSLAYESLNNMPEDHYLYNEAWVNPIIIDFPVNTDRLKYVSIQVADRNHLVLVNQDHQKYHYALEKIPFEERSEYRLLTDAREISNRDILYIRCKNVNRVFDLAPFKDPFTSYYDDDDDELEEDEDYYNRYGGANYFERIFDNDGGYYSGGYGFRRSMYLNFLPFTYSE